MAKLTTGQVNLLERAERQAHKRNDPLLYNVNAKTRKVLADLGYLDYVHVLVSDTTDRIKRMQELDDAVKVAKNYLCVLGDWTSAYVWLARARVHQAALDAQGWFITEAGRQALIAHNGGH